MTFTISNCDRKDRVHLFYQLYIYRGKTTLVHLYLYVEAGLNKKRSYFYFYLSNFLSFKNCFICIHVCYTHLYFTALYGVIRNRGNFGDVNVSWVVSPDFTQDVFPVQGILFFGDQEFSKNITIYSLPDEVSVTYITLFLMLSRYFY